MEKVEETLLHFSPGQKPISDEMFT